MDALQQLHLLGGGTGGCMDALQQLYLLGGADKPSTNYLVTKVSSKLTLLP